MSHVPQLLFFEWLFHKYSYINNILLLLPIHYVMVLGFYVQSYVEKKLWVFRSCLRDHSRDLIGVQKELQIVEMQVHT